MRLIFGLTGLLINKIAAYGVKPIHNIPYRLHYIQKNAPIDAVYTLVPSLDLISSKMKPELVLRSMEIVIDPGEIWFQQDGATCHKAQFKDTTKTSRKKPPLNNNKQANLQKQNTNNSSGSNNNSNNNWSRDENKKQKLRKRVIVQHLLLDKQSVQRQSVSEEEQRIEEPTEKLEEKSLINSDVLKRGTHK